MGISPSASLGEPSLQLIENCVTAADGFKVALLEMNKVGTERSKLELPIRELRLKLGKAFALSRQFFLFRRQEVFSERRQGEYSRRLSTFGP